MTDYDAFCARLTQAILRARGAEDERLGTYVNASEVGNCIRQTYYRITQTPIDDGQIEKQDDFNLVLESGNAFEALFTRQLIYASEFGIAFKGKRRLASRQYNISGETDPTIIFEGKRVVIEMKANHRDEYLKNLDLLRKNICPERYYNQLQTYLWTSPELDLGVLLLAYRNMNYRESLPPFVLHPVERDSKWRDKNWNRMLVLKKAIENKEPPIREGTSIDEFPCNYCNYKLGCWL